MIDTACYDKMHHSVYELQYGDYQDRMTFHLLLGFACKIPLCCVLFFVGTYSFDRKGFIPNLEATMESRRGRRNNKSFSLCPDCTLKQLLKLGDD